jgi:hypothetical protein
MCTCNMTLCYNFATCSEEHAVSIVELEVYYITLKKEATNSTKICLTFY